MEVLRVYHCDSAFSCRRHSTVRVHQKGSLFLEAMLVQLVLARGQLEAG